MLLRLKNGLKNFKEVTYKKHEQLYHDLEQVQNPHTLFIACSDSRVNPERLIGSNPGEIFTIRNIANTVPAYEVSHNDFTTVSAIEFAIEVLKVREVIICGHSNCGGCAAALEGQEKLDQLPYTQQYLKPLESIKVKVEHSHHHKDAESKVRLMEQLNVITQLNNLKSYPQIQQLIAKGELEVEGWHYDIKSGDVFVYDEPTRSFCKSDEYQNIHQ